MLGIPNFRESRVLATQQQKNWTAIRQIGNKNLLGREKLRPEKMAPSAQKVCKRNQLEFVDLRVGDVLEHVSDSFNRNVFKPVATEIWTAPDIILNSYEKFVLEEPMTSRQQTPVSPELKLIRKFSV